MNTTGSTVLITGGSAGIGLALAERFSRAGSTVIVCGRRADVLDRAKAKLTHAYTIQCDVEQESQRVELFERVRGDFPNLNVLVNNAGIQVRPPSWRGPIDWQAIRTELRVNFEAPVHLCALFAPFLAGKADAAVINVTSGLAFVPLAMMPTYCATKAALHSFTMSLRVQLAGAVEVIEIAPPAVDTDLGGPGLHTFGTPLDEFADHAFKMLECGEQEFGYGMSEHGRLAAQQALGPLFERMNSAQH